MPSLRDEITIVNDRPIPKDPLAFFQYKKGTRIMVSIIDTPSVWRADLGIAERIFADMVICPTDINSRDSHNDVLEQTRAILQQRTKYPGVKENPELEKIAKTWILPHKIHLGPSAQDATTDFLVALQPLFETLKADPMVHFLKIEVADGKERELVYKVLDQALRPSLILVKWSNDLDEHTPTAYCAGHLLNTGYSLIAHENGYGLYMFRDQPLYDICSMKTPSLTNPMMDSLIQSVRDTIIQQKPAPTEETKSEA
jgi:hypothetical protein